VGHIARIVGKRKAYRLLEGKARMKETTRKANTVVGG
jgi:hypothetical protein